MLVKDQSDIQGHIRLDQQLVQTCTDMENMANNTIVQDKLYRG